MVAKQFKPKDFAALLGLDSDDPRLWQGVADFGINKNQIEQIDDSAWIEGKPVGISLMFTRVEPSSPSSQMADSPHFRTAAFHLHGEGHEGYSEYKGDLGGNVQFGDTKEQIESKLGIPNESGGGGISKVIKGQRIPRWMKYKLGPWFAQYQMDEDGKLEMVTLNLDA